MDWMLLPLKRYADFNGRSRRKEYWMITLLSVIIYAICFAIMLGGMPWSQMMAADSGQQVNEPPGVMFWFGLTLLVVWALSFRVLLFRSVASTIRTSPAGCIC